jgi:hypothetical protein
VSHWFDGEELLEALIAIREDIKSDRAEAIQDGNNEGAIFFRGESSGITYAIDMIEGMLEP